jgi:hypothetical protein
LFAAGNTLCLLQEIPFICGRKCPLFAAGNTLRLLQEIPLDLHALFRACQQREIPGGRSEIQTASA